MKSRKRTRRGWRRSEPVPIGAAIGRPVEPDWGLRLVVALDALGESDQARGIRLLGEIEQLGESDRQDALARLADGLGIPPPPSAWKSAA